MGRARRSVVVTVLALVLAACGGNEGGSAGRSSGQPDAGVSGRVSLLVFGAPEELQAFWEPAAAFKAPEPDVDVKPSRPATARPPGPAATSFAGGTPPDLFLLNYRFYAQFAAKGALEPLRGAGKRLQGPPARDFYPQALDALPVRRS